MDVYSVGEIRRRGAPSMAKELKAGSERALASLRNVRSRSFNSLTDAQKNFLGEVKGKIKTELKSVAAEAEEFISTPHLLFRPVSMILAIGLPLIFPLFFIPLKILLGYIVSFLLWYVTLVAYFATEVAMKPPWYRTGLSLKAQPSYWKHCVHNPLEDLQLEFEDVEFQGAEGRTLRGWFVPVPEYVEDKSREKIMIVCVHGAGRDRRAFLRHSQIFAEAGYPILMFDLSEHGLSDGQGRGFSFGRREKLDVLSSVRYLRKARGAERVVVVGTSTGASSAILAEGLYPGSIDAIIAENPFTRPADLFRLHLNETLKNYLSQNQHHIMRRLTFWYFSRILLIRAGHSLRNTGAVDVVKNVRCPLFVLHGTSDEVVPISHGEAIYEAATCDVKAFWAAKDAIHCALFDKYPEEWKSRALNFLEQAVC